MRERESGYRESKSRRGAGPLLAAAGCLALLAGGCEPFTPVTDVRLTPSPGEATVLDGTELSLVTTRFAGEPQVIYSRARRFLLSISFDPEMVDLSQLETVRLWAQDRQIGRAHV